MGDWVSLLFDRIFAIFEDQSEEGKGTDLESAIGEMCKSLVKVVFQSVSEEIYRALFRKLLGFVRSKILPGAMKTVGHTVAAACSVRPGLALGDLMPVFHSTLITETGGIQRLSDSELLWFFCIASHSVKHAGTAILGHRVQITDIVAAALACPNKKVFGFGCDLLQNTLAALTETYPSEQRNFPESVWNSPSFASEHFLRWGESATSENLAVSWHVPSAEEVAFSNELIGTFGVTAMRQLEALMASPQPTASPSSSPPLPQGSVAEAGELDSAQPLETVAVIPARSPPSFRIRAAGAIPTPSASPVPGPGNSHSSPYQRRPFGASLSPAVPERFSFVESAPSPTPTRSRPEPVVIPKQRSLSLAPHGPLLVPHEMVVEASLFSRTMSTPGPAVTPPPYPIAHLWASKRIREQMWRLLHRLRSVIIGSSPLLVDAPHEKSQQVSSHPPPKKIHLLPLPSLVSFSFLLLFCQ